MVQGLSAIMVNYVCYICYEYIFINILYISYIGDDMGGGDEQYDPGAADNDGKMCN